MLVNSLLKNNIYYIISLGVKMKYFKNLIPALLLIMCFSLAGCGAENINVYVNVSDN